MDSWSDYCGGSSYTLEYVSGPKCPDPCTNPSAIDINALYSSKTKYNTPGLATNPYLEGTIPDITWEGNHKVNLVA